MSSNQLPKVTIVTITYNAEDNIEKTIKSVLSQEYKNIEYIIIDGNSTDNTMNIINKYNESIDLIVSEPDNGIYDAMNKGLRYATGDWVNFLNAGDLFYDSLILTNVFENIYEDTKFVYGDWINTSKKGLNRYIQSNPILNIKELKSKFQMNHQAIFVKNDNLPEYDVNYKIKADYQWVIDIVNKISTDEIIYLKQPLVYYDIDGISSNMMLLNLREYIYLTYRNFRLFQVLSNIRIYSRYFIKYIIHKYIYSLR